MLMESQPNSQIEYLVISAHPDDAEISVGGILGNLIEDKASVGILDLTNGEPTPHGTIELRAKETAAASAVLGVSWRFNLGLENRKLENSLPNRERVASVLRLLRPRVIMTHHPMDTHPDHVAASQIVDGARFWSKLSKSNLPGAPWYPPVVLHFFSIHLLSMPKPKIVIDVTSKFEKKLEAISCYESQLIIGKPVGIRSPIAEIEMIGRSWGRTINKTYGEPLDCKEEIGIGSIKHVI